jgi:ubiquinone/menaquinone biosynthesis C-methylase UbiE
MNAPPSQFGRIAKEYEKGRRAYDFNAMEYVCALIRKASNKDHPLVLDLGCGTGISTRQLYQNRIQVVGCDKDEKMIDVARKHDSSIVYTVGDSQDLRFCKDYFDAVTAFGAFHWFTDVESIVNIQHVTKRRGIFAVINKNDTGDFRQIFDESLNDAIGFVPRHAKLNYNPVKSLRERLFADVKEATFDGFEMYDLDEVLMLCQSLNAWNSVPEGKRRKVLDELRKNFSARLRSEFYTRTIETVVVSGVNNKR